MKTTHICLTLLVMLFCTACPKQQGYLPVDQVNSQSRLVAVLPLTNLSTYPKAGRIVGDLLTTSFYARKEFQVMDQANMLTKLETQNEEADADIDRAMALKVGKSLGASAVVFGSVSEFRYKRGLDENPVVGINLRMLDVASNTIIWAGGRSATGGCFGLCEDSLTSLAQKVCNELVASIPKSKGL